MDSRKEGRVWAWIALVVFAVVVWGLSYTRKEVRADVFIDAPIAQVWRVVTDLRAYPQWNPYMRLVNGRLSPGEKLMIVLQPVGARASIIHPTVVSVVPNQLMSWRERLVLPGIFDGYYTLRLEALSPTQTRVFQHETYSGLIVLPSQRWLETSVQSGMIQMNAALKYYIEGKTLLIDPSGTLFPEHSLFHHWDTYHSMARR